MNKYYYYASLVKSNGSEPREQLEGWTQQSFCPGGQSRLEEI